MSSTSKPGAARHAYNKGELYQGDCPLHGLTYFHVKTDRCRLCTSEERMKDKRIVQEAELARRRRAVEEHQARIRAREEDYLV